MLRPQDEEARLRKLPRQIVAAVAVLATLGAVALALDLANRHREERATGKHGLQSHAVSLAEHVAVTLQEADSLLQLVAPQIERAGGPARMEERLLQDLFHDRVSKLAQVAAMFVLDADGVAVANTSEFPTRRISMADRDYFIVPRDDRSSGTFVGRPVRTRMAHKWRFFVTRRLQAPDGSFAGVVGAVLDPAYYDHFYRSLELPEHSRIVVLRTDGVLLVETPALADAIDMDFSTKSIITTHLPSANRGVFRDAVSVVDGQDRTIAYQRVRGYPVVAIVSLPTADLVATWRRDAVARVASGAALLAVIVALAAVLIRGVRQLEASIAAQRALEQEMFRASKLESLGILAGGIAHDFGNLLAVILCGIETVRDAFPPGSKERTTLDDSARATGRAADLTKQLLAFSKGGAPVRETTQMSELLRESARFALHGSRSTLRLDVGPDLWSAHVDPGQISQVVQNLIINADQAMPEGGTVLLSARNRALVEPQECAAVALPPGRFVQIAVADEGVGIAPEHVDRIFDPFFTTKPNGHGLGLATVHAIVRKHGGAIRVEPKLRRGTRFVVLLPAADEAPRAERGAAASRPIPPGTRILVMDDNEELRRGVASMLSRIGCEAETCADGGAAVQRYREAFASGRRFDLVLTDLTVRGGMSGADAAKAIQRIDPDACILVSSGYSDLPVFADPARYGITGCLAKPYTLAQLRAAITAALAACAAA